MNEEKCKYYQSISKCLYKGNACILKVEIDKEKCCASALYRAMDLEEQLKRLEQENKALVKENEDMKKSFVSHSEFMNILENNPNINWEETAKENIYLINKYHKALEEIKRMVKGHKIADETRLQVIEGLINKVLESEGE